MKHLPIHERFLSFQGEGEHAGRKAFFIRTMGCPLHCPWCDSAGTWHKDWVPKEINKISITTLADEAKASGAAFAVITGGEPCIHRDISILACELQDRGIKVHLETCGAYSPTGKQWSFDWITLSPKHSELPTPDMMDAANEFKIIVDEPDAVPRWEAILVEITGRKDWFIQQGRVRPVWLHPEWSRRNDKAILDTITKAVITCGDPFKAGWQMHKLFHADAHDPRSVYSAPLGGNPAKGPAT